MARLIMSHEYGMVNVLSFSRGKEEIIFLKTAFGPLKTRKSTKISVLRQNINSPDRFTHDVKRFTDFFREFCDFRGQLFFSGY